MKDEMWREILRLLIAYHKMKVAKHNYKVAKWEVDLLETYDYE